MKSQFLIAFNEICREKNLPADTVIDALKTALVSAYRRNSSVSSSQGVTADIDPRTGEVAVYAEKEVAESIIDDRTEVTLEVARQFNPEAELGDLVMVESTPKNFGRIAAQTAKQVILQRVREAERDHLFEEFSGREGEIVNGTVQSLSGGNITIGLGRTEAVLPRGQQVYRERYRAHDKIRVYILEVRRTSRGPQIIVSRSHRNLLRRLLELEVPEIYNGQVDIKSIAREAGQRSKIAVKAMQPGVDPVGACVGMRGVRIQSIVRELNDEKIDVIEWDQDSKNFIAKALSPARVALVFLDDDPVDGRTATVVVPDDQLSLAIGREGQNARLAAKLTGWRIDIKSLTEAGRDSLDLLDNPMADPALVADHGLHATVLEVIAKKEAGRPITAEDFNNISKLVAGIEGKIIAARAAEHEATRQVQASAQSRVPEAYWELELEELNLPLSLHNLFLENRLNTVGEIAYRVELGGSELLIYDGFNDESLDKVKAKLAELAELRATEGVDDTASAETEEAEVVAEAEAPVEEVVPVTPQPVVYDEPMPDFAELLAVDESLLLPDEEEEEEEEEEPTSALDDLSQSLIDVDPTVKRKKKDDGKKKIRVSRSKTAPATDAEDDGTGKSKAKELVFDENAGRVVTKRKRKKNRSIKDFYNDDDVFDF